MSDKMTTTEQLKDKLKKLTSRWYYSKEEIDNSLVDNTSFNSSISDVYSTFDYYQTITMGYGTSYQNKNVVTDNTGKITVEAKPTIPSKTSDLTNDSGFITSHQDISEKADISDFDTVTATVTYTDDTTETITFYVVPDNLS